MIKYVLEKVIGITDYKIRYEFQNRGSIHAHMLVCISHGPTAKDLQEAMKVELRDKTAEEKDESPCQKLRDNTSILGAQIKT